MTLRPSGRRALNSAARQGTSLSCFFLSGADYAQALKILILRPAGQNIK